MTPSSPRYARVHHRGQPSYVLLPEQGPAQLLTAAPWLGGRPSGTELPQGSVGSDSYPLLCPAQPSKIIGIGRNYKKHAEELKNEVPEQPLMFFKPPSSLLDPGGCVELPPESERVDYEAELVVVIGQRCRRASRSEAESAIFGYGIGCDVTARDLQQKDKQWTRAKGFDTFCPFGPFVVALSDASRLRVQLSIHGQSRQDGWTSDMIFDVPTLVAYASQSMTLEPGDLIFTGTPEGVGPLTRGDAVSIRIDSLGELKFRVTGPA
ncbi:MAG TPA: fumarylacetoacetate hydrolase family protein [Polyangiaceae bacterium]|nr:fumarylacetoacetate hydrolase family protein [Polyangiaceae bacterium]